MNRFTHLHVHSQYSILDGAAPIIQLIAKAKEDGMTALAITDHGYMFGVKEFYDECVKQKIKPLLGCETYVAQRSLYDKSEVCDRSGRHLILIAKNKIGYKNLLVLCSIAATKGFYYRARVDKELLKKHSEGLIACSACLGGEVPKCLEMGDIEGARKAILWYKEVFGEDYYLELQLHPAEDAKKRAEIYDKQVAANKIILQLAKEYGVKVVATNDVHFVNENDAESHDLLVCMSTGKSFEAEDRMRYTRHEWLKTHDEMSALFAEVPEAISNTCEIANKVENYQLNSEPIMPFFPIPSSFGVAEDYMKRFSEAQLLEEFGEKIWENAGGYQGVLRIKLEFDYLCHLTTIGAQKIFGKEIEKSTQERIDFELSVIKQMGFPGYFLITQDFIREAKKLDVLVGPGRGSAAGSVVSYCLGITNIDPIKHHLLFERFLNPDRISMPDVDIDFDDDGRELVIKWVCEKYGYDKVARICTFGTLAAKSAIKDVARVYQLPLSEANRLAKLVPEDPKIVLEDAFELYPELHKEKYSSNPLIVKTVQLASALQGSIKSTGVHACGVLIGRDPLQEHIPLMSIKGLDMYATQYDGHFVEKIGLLKMDFLGLRTLSILKETIENIRLSKGLNIDLNSIPEEDVETFQLFCEGNTTAIFQFESPGMKKHLQALRPECFDHLVAMNALYRPGPMAYIPDFISRRHGLMEITYDHPLMEKYLEDTYGITVYQEQVMLLSRELAQFTRGESDNLRKAMGKKKKEGMDELKDKFVNGCLNNEAFIEGLKPEEKKNPQILIDKIWNDWIAFAQYAFNKSHSVCYAKVAYLTAYFKTHFPAEFMAGVLSRNLADIKKISESMDECKRMDLQVKGPDVNESYRKFTVNNKGELRFGMAGVKGVGEAAVEHIIEERNNHGPFVDIFDFAARINLRTVNKKNWEALACSGAFDNMGINTRSQFFYEEEKGLNLIEKILRYGNAVQKEKQDAVNSLFGSYDEAANIKKPTLPTVEPWPRLVELEKEKELIGIYLSGHPLDDYSLILEHHCNISMDELNHLELKMIKKGFIAAGIVTNFRSGITKTGGHYGVLTVEDFSGAKDFFLFGNNYVLYSKFFIFGLPILIKGEFEEKYQNKEEKKIKKEKEVDTKINSIELLSEIKDNIFNSLTLQLDADSITEEVMEDICSVIEYNLAPTSEKGVRLYVSVRGMNSSSPVDLISRAGMFHVDKKTYNVLDGIEGVSVSIK